MQRSIVLLYSDGLKSTVLLYHLTKEGYDVRKLMFIYPWQPKQEIVKGTKTKIINLESINETLNKDILLHTMIWLGSGYAYNNNCFTLAYGGIALYDPKRQKRQFVLAHKDLDLYYPFNNLSLTEIVKLGDQLNVPMELTWSCNTIVSEDSNQCGACKKCLARREAFKLANVVDNTRYGNNRKIDN